jgi:L,D-transpeptidase ErfK/SrfK
MAQASTILSTLILAGLLVANVPPSSLTPFPSSESFQPSLSEETDSRHLQSLQARYKSLSAQLSRLRPQQSYILIDTARNHLFVKRRHEVVLDAIASTGSGTILEKPGEGNDQWVFDTPRGEFLVQSKLTHPAWVKPDWAFIEERAEIPANPADRVEQGVLGEYALGFGKGYFIHGTLYTRLLGKNVTHGCIRLNDSDLKSVYQFARVGTPIIIF